MHNFVFFLTSLVHETYLKPTITRPLAMSGQSIFPGMDE